MGKLSGQEFAKEFESFINGASDAKKQEFADWFCRMHNTNMQSAFGAILKVVDKVATLPYVDGRNKDSHERAIMMVDGFKKEQSLQLQHNDAYYWTKKKADEWIFSENYDFTSFPLI
tara:strand:- start:349 stop:699 length:351 start_codon:yes stop_codon:yes gene_type:complete